MLQILTVLSLVALCLLCVSRQSERQCQLDKNESLFIYLCILPLRSIMLLFSLSAHEAKHTRGSLILAGWSPCYRQATPGMHAMRCNITTGHRRYDHWFIGCSYRIDIEPYFTAANDMVGTMSLLPPQSSSAGVTDDPLRYYDILWNTCCFL
jgi:hypothetical protein